MTDQPQPTPKEAQIRANQTIRLSPEELKALMAQARQGETASEKKPWED
jgi:hypothetical protein